MSYQWSIQSRITKFQDEFESHIRDRRCNLFVEVASADR